MSKNAVTGWDFTLPADELSVKELQDLLNNYCKKWVFQKERGEKTGYEHYQGRIKLKVKNRKPSNLMGNKFHFSVTSNENCDNDFYVTKEDTRIDGPYCDSDEVIYIPRQIREVEKLWAWQESVIEKSQIWDTRTINIVIDMAGNNGKTTLKGYMRAHKLGRPIPFCNDFKDIMRMVMDMPTAQTYLIDMPRAVKKDKLFQLFAGIESIKDGYAYDDRYTFKEKYFDCPNIWVFMNYKPDMSMLSTDRWTFWEIVDKKLVPRVYDFEEDR